MEPVCAGCSTPYTVGLPACPNCGSAEVRAAGAAFPQMRVACRAEGCRAAGRVAVVRLPSVAPNIVAVPALACTLCGRQVEIVAAWEDNDMPKITKHGGATNVLADPPAPAAPAPEPKEEVASSPGNSSRTSSAKDEPSPKTKPADSPRRARTTGSRSGKARTAGSTARGTGGGQTEATSETG